MATTKKATTRQQTAPAVPPHVAKTQAEMEHIFLCEISEFIRQTSHRLIQQLEALLLTTRHGRMPVVIKPPHEDN